MKKTVIMILVIALIISFSAPVEANQVNSLYIETTECPQNYIDFTEENISKFVDPYALGVQGDEITVGTDYLTFYSDIDLDHPVYVSMQSPDPTDSSSMIYHAVVLRGYNARRCTWSIWNPWFDYFETISEGGPYVPTGYSSDYVTFNFRAAIYHWAP